jgi:hypothetical protein
MSEALRERHGGWNVLPGDPQFLLRAHVNSLSTARCPFGQDDADRVEEPAQLIGLGLGIDGGVDALGGDVHAGVVGEDRVQCGICWGRPVLWPSRRECGPQRAQRMQLAPWTLLDTSLPGMSVGGLSAIALRRHERFGLQLSVARFRHRRMLIRCAVMHFGVETALSLLRSATLWREIPR